MSNINDNKILELKKQIENKKVKLTSYKQHIGQYKTNKIIEFSGVKYNLNVLKLEELTILLINLNMFRLSAMDLNLLDKCIISGYHINDWLDDITTKIHTLECKSEEQKLANMESTLNKMLSDDKKIELELAEIEGMLKE